MANEFFTDEHTAVLSKLVREIVNDPSTYLGSKYLPAVAVPARKIRTEIIEASGGMTNEHLIGTDPLYINRSGSRIQEYEPQAYKEMIRFDEKDILYMRELGQNDASKRGIRQHIDIQVDRLNRRLEARIEFLRWRAIFDGGFTYLGKTFSYGIPAQNRIAPSVPWMLPDGSANPAANPLADIRFWVTGGTPLLRKYVPTELVMNPNTARVILDNPNTQSFIKTYFSADNFGGYDIEKVISLAVPGAPKINIYRGWYQEESLDANGKLIVGDAIYFVKDGEIFMESTLPDGDKLGEFVETLHLASGTIDAPGFGKYLVVEDNTVAGSKGGPKNPYMDVIAGVHGGVKLDRVMDVITFKVN